MDWKETYVKKFTNSEITDEKVNIVIGEFIENLNEIFEKYNIEDKKIEFDKDKKVIAFPDCIISYQIRNSLLTLTKVDKVKQSSVLGSCNVNFINNAYYISATKETPINFDKELIEKVFEYLLTKIKSR